jgi:hypothetical protein
MKVVMGPRRHTCLAAALGLLACGGVAPNPSHPSFSGVPLVTLPSASGALRVAVRSSPQPPSRGLSLFELTLTDDSGAPAAGLVLAVQPWMPAMGHGTSVVPEVAETAPGVYEVSNVVLAMPGTWQLRTSVSGSQADTFAPSFEIP